MQESRLCIKPSQRINNFITKICLQLQAKRPDKLKPEHTSPTEYNTLNLTLKKKRNEIG